MAKLDSEWPRGANINLTDWYLSGGRVVPTALLRGGHNNLTDYYPASGCPLLTLEPCSRLLFAGGCPTSSGGARLS